MTIIAAIRVALAALRLNAMRSFLAMLGVIIGVGSVIIMVSIGEGAGRAVEDQIRSLGTNVLVIRPGAFDSGGRRMGAGSAPPFSEADVAAIRAVPGVAAVSGVVTSTYPVVFGATNWTTQIHGVHEDFLTVRDWALASGRIFTPAEQRRAAKVAILGATVAEKLFGAADPVGAEVRIKNVPFTVIGVLDRKGQTGFGLDQDDAALIPVSTMRRRLAGGGRTIPDRIQTIMVKLDDGANSPAVQAQIDQLLREGRRLQPDGETNFMVRDMTEMIRTRAATQSTLSLLLGATAVISLIVGGIGIMNIMLVSVTERTREIGLRMAVGARRWDILVQFLIEAVTLCLTGGLVGVMLGLIVTVALAQLGAWPVAINPMTILIALLSSAVSGIIFGLYPARRASQMNPIDALRYE